jgi:hypothetical protein
MSMMRLTCLLRAVVSRQLRRQELECDEPIEMQVAAAIHDAHAAGAELLEDFVMGDCLTSHEPPLMQPDKLYKEGWIVDNPR